MSNTFFGLLAEFGEANIPLVRIPPKVDSDSRPSWTVPEESAANAADSSRVSTMSCFDDDYSAVVAGSHDRRLVSGGGAFRGSDSRKDSPLVFNSMRWLWCTILSKIASAKVGSPR